MKSMFEILSVPQVQTPIKSQRNFILSQIIESYRNPKEDLIRKKENFKRYIQYCKDNRLHWKRPEAQSTFKNSRLFLKPYTDKQVAIFLAPLSCTDLFYVSSVCRDKVNRGESVGMYIKCCTNAKIEQIDY